MEKKFVKKLIILLVIQSYQLNAQFPLDTLFERKEIPQSLLGSNVRFGQALNGKYSISFFKNDTVVADLQFNTDSSLSYAYLLFQDKLLINAYTENTRHYSVIQCEFSGFPDATYVRYLHESDLLEGDTSSQFIAKNGNKEMSQSIFESNCSYVFLENTTNNDYIIYTTNKNNEIVSKTYMRRASLVNLSKEYKAFLARHQLFFTPVKKVYYRSGRINKIEKYKDGKPIKSRETE